MDEHEDKLWALLDRHDRELEALEKQILEHELDPMFRIYMVGLVRTRKRVTAAITEAYIDEKE